MKHKKEKRKEKKKEKKHIDVKEDKSLITKMMHKGAARGR